MARTKAPLFSLGASGSIGGSIVFATWKGRAYVRELVTPSNPQSGLQVGMRAALRFNSQVFSSIGATAQANWKAEGKPRNITALDAMVGENGTAVRQNFGPKKDPTDPAGAVEAAPTAQTATAQPKSIKVTWTDSAGANDWCTMIWMSKTNGFTPDVSNLIRIIPRGVQSFTVAGLTTGTPYYFQLAGVEVGGTIGTHTAQFSATPT
jgi:hypothetical protein